MGVVKNIGKYDINTNDWYHPVKKEDKLTSLSIVKYKPIKNLDSDIFNYVIAIDGCRLENHSEDVLKVDDNRGGMNNIIDYFNNKEMNTKIYLLLVDKEAPLKKESLYISNVINKLVNNINVNSINVLGISKGGLIAYNAMKYLINDNNKIKTNIYAYSAPYNGTIMASPIYLKESLTEYINSHFSSKYMNEILVNKIMEYYYKTSSNSHMDLDIAINGGIPINLMKGYDSTFLNDMFSKDNINGLNNVHSYNNICAIATDKVLKESILKSDMFDIGLCLLNKILFNGNGDGFVDIASSSTIDYHTNVNSIYIESTHRLTHNNKALTKILDMVKKNI